MTEKKDVEEVAASNTTEAARRPYRAGQSADRALKASVGSARGAGRGRTRRAAAAAPAGPMAGMPMTAAQRKAAEKQAKDNERNAEDIARPSGVDHSYSALDTTPPNADRASKVNATPAKKGRKSRK